MEETKRLYEELKEWAEAYGKSSLELVKLKSTQLSAKTAGPVGLYAILLVLMLFFLNMLSIGTAIWLGDMWGDLFLGFFAVAGFYLLVVIILLLFKKSLVIRPIQNIIIRNILK